MIEQKNGGPALARNAGLRTAQGKYVYFVDGDDYIIPSAFPRVLDFLRNNDTDILDFEASTFFERTGETEFKKRQYPIASGTGQEIFVAWEKAKLMENACWRRIFRRSLISDNDVYFIDVYEGEDEEWTPRIFSYAGRVVHLPLCVYVYRRRENSITQSRSTRRTFTDIIKISDSLVEFSKSPHLSSEFRKTLLGVISYIYWRSIRGIKIDGRFDDELISEIERRFYLMDYNVKFSRRYLYRPFIRTFGLKAFYALKYWNRRG